MNMDTNLITYLACICFLFIFGKIFIVPIRKVLKIIVNSILGGATIFLINLIGGIWGFHIGLNLFTAILVRHIRSTRGCIFDSSKNNIRWWIIMKL